MDACQSAMLLPSQPSPVLSPINVDQRIQLTFVELPLVSQPMEKIRDEGSSKQGLPAIFYSLRPLFFDPPDYRSTNMPPQIPYKIIEIILPPSPVFKIVNDTEKPSELRLSNEDPLRRAFREQGIEAGAMDCARVRLDRTRCAPCPMLGMVSRT